MAGTEFTACSRVEIPCIHDFGACNLLVHQVSSFGKSLIQCNAQVCMYSYQLFAARLYQTQLDIPPAGDAASTSDLCGQEQQLQQFE